MDIDAPEREEMPGRGDIDLAVALASGLPQQQAAERAGLSRATVDRRLNDPAFRLLVLELLHDRRDALLAQSVEGASVANTFLMAVVLGREEGASLSHRIRAAAILRGTGVLGYGSSEP